MGSVAVARCILSSDKPRRFSEDRQELLLFLPRPAPAGRLLHLRLAGPADDRHELILRFLVCQPRLHFVIPADASSPSSSFPRKREPSCSETVRAAAPWERRPTRNSSLC